MGPARFWDDPDADLDKTVDLRVPPAVRARFEPTPREIAILEEVIHALRMVGLLLLCGGMLTLPAFDGRVRWAMMVNALVTFPGGLYLVASFGLLARRYWAWVMSLAVTTLLMLVIFAIALYQVAQMSEPGEALVLVPLALLFAMPSLILLYMLRARPVIRDAQLLVGSGFDVVPLHENDTAAESPPPPPLAVQLKPADSGATSPSPAPPAPSPPTPPPRS
jgi:hypothetical protein